jgi:hypothetical protein
MREGICIYSPVNAGIAQLVERNLAKVDVAGSNPVSRSALRGTGTFGNRARRPHFTHFLFKVAPPPPIPPGGGVLFLPATRIDGKPDERTEARQSPSHVIHPLVPARCVARPMGQPEAGSWRRTQVVRERSAKPLCGGSNPPGASSSLCFAPFIASAGVAELVDAQDLKS